MPRSLLAPPGHMLTSLQRSTSENTSLAHTHPTSNNSSVYHILVPGIPIDTATAGTGSLDKDVKSIQVTLSRTTRQGDPPAHQVQVTPLSQDSVVEADIHYPILDITWSASGQEYALVDSLGTGYIFNEKTGQLVESIYLNSPLTTGSSCRILFNKKADKVLISDNKRVCVWDRKEGKWSQDIHGCKKGTVSCMSLHVDSTRLATGSTLGEVYTFNFKTNQYGLFKSSMTTTITDIAFSHFRTLFAAVGECGTLAVWDLTQKREPIYEKVKAHQGPIRGVQFSPSNKDWFCTVGFDKMIKVHQLTERNKGQVAERVMTHDSVVLEVNMGAPGTSLSLHADHTMAVGTSQGDVLLYKIGWKHPIIVKRLGYPIHRISLSPLVSTSSKLSSSTSHPDLSTLDRLSTAKLVSKRVASLGQEKNYMDMFSPVHSKSSQLSAPVAELKVKGPLFKTQEPVETRQESVPTSPKDSQPTLDSNSSTPNSTSPSQRRFKAQETRDLTEPPSAVEKTVENDDSRVEMSKETLIQHTPVARSSVSSKPISVLNARVSMPTPLVKTLSHVDENMGQLHQTIVSEYAKRTNQELVDLPTKESEIKVESEPVSVAPVQFHYQVLENVIEESLHTFRSHIRNDIMNMHVEILRQFHIQKNELEALFIKYAPTKALEQEMEILRQENDRLRKNY